MVQGQKAFFICVFVLRVVYRFNGYLPPVPHPGQGMMVSHELEQWPQQGQEGQPVLWEMGWGTDQGWAASDMHLSH